MNRRAWLLALVALVLLGLLGAGLMRPKGGVDPGTVAPRGANAPTGPDPEAQAAIQELKKARKQP